jgi:hypothetical protein
MIATPYTERNSPIEVSRLTFVAPGRMGDYLSWLQNNYRPALEGAGVAHFQVSQLIFRRSGRGDRDHANAQEPGRNRWWTGPEQSAE